MKQYLTRFLFRRNENGEIRADLVVPSGFAVITYDTQSIPSASTVGGMPLNNTNTLVIPARVTVRLTGMTGSPTAVHIHASASRGFFGPALVWLCHNGNCPPTLPVPNAGSVISFPIQPSSYSAVFDNVMLPLQVVAGRSAYFNVHTAANVPGEVRGQIRPAAVFATTGAQVNGSFGLSVYQSNARIAFDYIASPEQQLPPSFIFSCANASFRVTFDPNPNPNTVSFSDIVIKGLSTPLSQVHIHGPCPNAQPCDAPVIYFICGGPVAPCPQSLSPTIPAFVVNQAQTAASADGSLLIGLLADILSGSNLYYVNFHTTT